MPQPFEHREVSGHQQKDENDQQRDDPLGRVGKPAAEIGVVGNDCEKNKQHNQRDYLNCVIDGAGDEPVADRSQGKMQRHALRRFDYQGFIAGDDG